MKNHTKSYLILLLGRTVVLLARKIGDAYHGNGMYLIILVLRSEVAQIKNDKKTRL